MVVQMTRAEYQAKYGIAPGGSTGAPAVPATPPATNTPPVKTISSTGDPMNTPAAPSTGTPVKMTKAEYQIKYGVTPDVPKPTPPVDNKSSGDLLGGLISAPATIAARPFQAIQGGVQYAEDAPALNKSTNDLDATRAEGDRLLEQYKAAKVAGQDVSDIARKITENTQRATELAKGNQSLFDRRPSSGGVIAPTPENFGDVKKDVGRGIETIALGTGAPLAGGAAFGLGNSLEQGNDLFSTQTAFNTVLGAGTGKLLGLIGKPLLNGAGKVVGTITPQVLKDIAAKGAGAITEFAANHQLLGGIAKPISEKIATGAENFDKKINDVFTGAKNKVGDVVASQYPAISKKGMQNRFSKIEAENFAKPTTETKASYRKATEIFSNAKDQGNDLGKIAVDNGITHSSLIDGKNYNTVDTAENLRNDAMKTSHDLIRPALEAAEPGVQRIPISQVREGMLSEVDRIPKTQITDAERETIKRRIALEYSEHSAAAKAHPDGYSLTDLHDNKISTASNGKYRPNGTMADNLRANQSRQESSVFRKLLEKNAPPELRIKEFNKALQTKFQLADYLEALHGKKVPMGITARAVDLFGKVAGASAGAQLGGGLGGVAGYHLGGVLFDAFENLPNPLKTHYLESLQKSDPAVFDEFRKYLSDQKAVRGLRPQLKAGNKMTANYPIIELGPHYSPEPNRFNNDREQNLRKLFNTKQLSAPESRIITPNTQGTPNPTSGTYGPGGDKGRVGGQGQRIGAYYKKNK